jgi:hypothetical protein
MLHLLNHLRLSSSLQRFRSPRVRNFTGSSGLGPPNSFRDNQPGLVVVFDKVFFLFFHLDFFFFDPGSLMSTQDGTLKDFHTSWVPWLKSNAKRVCSLLESGEASLPPSISTPPTVETICEAVGYYHERKPSLTTNSPLTHVSMSELRDIVEGCVGPVSTSLSSPFPSPSHLPSFLSFQEAIKGWKDKVCPKEVKIHPILPEIDSSLAHLRRVGGVRFAVATSDTESNAAKALQHFSIHRLFDLVVCFSSS